MSTILLLDDDPLFRKLVLEVLERRGHRVIEADTGQAATDALGIEAADLVIVDGLLPDTNGIAWIRSFRSQDGETPVIFVSSFWRDAASLTLLTKELRVGLVVHKPVMPAVFGEQVESQLERSNSRRPPPLSLDEDGLLAELKADYARRLPEKTGALRDATRSLLQSPGSRALLDEARVLAHKMRGTAGSYGFYDLGEKAGELEDALVHAREGSAGLSAAAALEIERVLGRVNAAGERAVATSQVERPVRPFTLASSTLLLIDNDAQFLEYMVELGRQQLVEVITAQSAEEALARASQTPPDMAILELHLPPPERSLSLARQLRELPGCGSLPLAFVSSDGRIDNRVAAAHAGASLYLAKPIEAEAFTAAIRQLLAAKDAGRPHVLVLDDDDEFAGRISLILRQNGIQATTLKDPLKTLETLEELRPDLLILDAIMPGVSGFDLCRMLRTTQAWQHLPILFLTAKTGLDSRLAAFQAGADDYLGKPIVTEELLARVRLRVERSHLLRERISKDALTGLLLRTPFVERFGAMLSHARRGERPVTLCLLDLDHFKAVNDGHGHLAGDRVLAALGKLLANRFRAEDLRARWGGEEFLLGFEGEIGETIQHVLTRVLGEFQTIAVLGEDGQPFTSTFSAGVASFPSDGGTLQEMLRVADRRLYAAKRAGRARVMAQG